MKKRKLLTTALRLVLTILIMGALLQIIQVHGVMSALAEANIYWLFTAHAFVALRRSVEAVQMNIIFRYLGYSIGWFRVFRANSLAMFYGMFTPGAVASVAKLADLTAVTGSGATVLNAVLYNRFMLDLQPILLGTVVLVWQNPTGEPFLAAAACILAIFAFALAFFLYSPRIVVPLLKKVQSLGTYVSLKVRERIGNINQKLAIVRNFPAGRHLRLLAFGFIAFSLGICARFAITKAVGFNVPVTAIIWVDAVLIVTSHFPITISNFGIREGLVVAAFGLYSVPYEQAFVYGILVYTCKLFIAIIGGIHQLMLVLGVEKARAVSISQPK